MATQLINLHRVLAAHGAMARIINPRVQCHQQVLLHRLGIDRIEALVPYFHAKKSRLKRKADHAHFGAGIDLTKRPFNVELLH